MATYRQTGKMAINGLGATNLPDPDVLSRLVIAESGFIFDPLLGKSYSINDNGIFILKHIQQGDTLDQIVVHLTKEYDVSREVAERDITEFVVSLQSQIR